MQTVSSGDNLHEMSKTVFLGKIIQTISKCGLLEILPRELSVIFFQNEISVSSAAK